MARTRGGDRSIPFMRAEDLHMWLISLTLLMVLTSSLSFVNNQFIVELESHAAEFAIHINWVVVFGACVWLWSVELLLNSEKAKWLFLFISMCLTILPRAWLPFRTGECMMHHICFIGFNFFTLHPTWKINFLCVSAVLIMIVSDVVRGALPAFLVALKSISALTTIAAGHTGYQIVRVFSRQLRETKRSALPIFSCLSRLHLRRGNSYNLANFDEPQVVGGGFSQCMKTDGIGYTDKVSRSSATFPHEPQSLNDCFGQAYSIWIGDVTPVCLLLTLATLAGRYVIRSEDSGVWYRERDSQLFIVPSGQYGYVDGRWYLDVNFARQLRWPSLRQAHSDGGKTACTSITPSQHDVPERGNATRNALSPTAHNTYLRFDTIQASRCSLSRFRRSLSAGQCPDTRGGSWGGSNESLCPDSQHNNGGGNCLQRDSGSSHHKDAPDGASRKQSEAARKKGAKLASGLRFGSMLPHALQKKPDAHQCCTPRYERYFLMSCRLGWKKNSGRRAPSEVMKRRLRRPGLNQSYRSWSCGCLPRLRVVDGHRNTDGREPYSGTGAREEVLMPKTKLGMFTDSAIERWYILWRADHIVAFYKETASINMVICALQCLFGIVRSVSMEHLTEMGDYRIGTVTGQVHLRGDVLTSISLGKLFRIFGRHVAQLGILLALTFPMKFIDSRGGRNVWKFQLLGLGQAVTHVVFIFIDVFIICYGCGWRPLDQNDGTIVGRAGAHFVIGGYLIFPLFMISLNVQLRRIPEATILVATVGSALTALSILVVLGSELKSFAFYAMTRMLYAVFAIMITRSFENIRREVFSTQVLPFLLYLSTLANSPRVDSIVAMRSKYHRMAQQGSDIPLS